VLTSDDATVFGEHRGGWQVPTRCGAKLQVGPPRRTVISLRATLSPDCLTFLWIADRIAPIGLVDGACD
jgi:hypothetical protein